MQQYLDKFGKLPGSTKLIILAVLLTLVTVAHVMLIHVEQASINELHASNPAGGGPPCSEPPDTSCLGVEELRIQRDKNQAIAEQLDEYKAKVARLTEDLERAKSLLPNDREIDDLLKQVANLGKKVGLEFLLFRPLPDVQKDFYAEVPVEISVAGDYHTVALFFSKIGQMKRIVNIQNVSMTAPQEKNGKILLTVNGQAVTFRFLESAVAAVPQQ